MKKVERSTTRSAALIATVLFAGCASSGLGEATRKDVTEQMTTTQSPISTCYENALRGDRKLRGRLVISATAKANSGKFENVKVVDSELPDEGLNACIIEHVQTLTLASPTTTDLAIRYPVEFSPIN